ncbi:hypothetical protein J5N97_011288 [Dioscorea zingiberensis]|uniref:Uncharacterized protein n=1 Tax=Dioscorea zingiberensis TaxID=325984 RepID=A0A9D5D2R9_9LILI|nr:hypothetical protein J5N97_011288 [Dioscorea zingiberensis]
MEAIRSSHAHPIHSFLSNHPTQSRKVCPYLIKQRHQRVYSKYCLQTPVIDNALVVAVTSKAPGGEISVLLPISAVLLFMYFISNFFVPSIVMKDLKTQTDADDKPEAENSSENQEEASMDSKPKLKIKKSSIKIKKNSSNKSPSPR